MPRDAPHQERIVQAAIALLDEGGIESLTMRRRGSRLGRARHIDLSINGSAPLLAVYVSVATVSMTAYTYDELVLRHREPRADYPSTVSSGRHPTSSTSPSRPPVRRRFP
ncbi:hypothetical protein [Streptomyces sp. TLI_55]|uniref:hypothetical protein n=1 Tax=Streptomyces sp. TLI_55 TaxID=1938861 RepID=UPI000BE37AD7|nr:hypothetical protein [Streptomyces sp. TLI_55]